MEFQLSYFKSWKMMLWKCCTQYVCKYGKLSNGHRTGKVWCSFPIPKKSNAKECSNYHKFAPISHTSKVMLNILKARLQHCMNWEISDVQAGIKKGWGTRDQIAIICWIIEKVREFQKNIFFFIDCAKAFDCVDYKIMEKFFKRREYETTLPASWEMCMLVKKR